ncbi:MAG: helix-turn-helix transcriptional regulator [Bdellovibrionaceae bacterium]|nr:helix-turn-helix transcriptional regulator [Pseudobdellovibrionaceae bacterium]
MKKKHFNCPAELTAKLIGGTWKSSLLYHLRKTPKRFGELRRLSPGLSQSTLSRELRDFEKNGIISKTKIGKEPYNGTEYALTEKGQTLKPILNAMIRWGLENQKDFVLGDFRVVTNQSK